VRVCVSARASCRLVDGLICVLSVQTAPAAAAAKNERAAAEIEREGRAEQAGGNMAAGPVSGQKNKASECTQQGAATREGTPGVREAAAARRSDNGAEGMEKATSQRTHGAQEEGPVELAGESSRTDTAEGARGSAGDAVETADNGHRGAGQSAEGSLETGTSTGGRADPEAARQEEARREAERQEEERREKERQEAERRDEERREATRREEEAKEVARREEQKQQELAAIEEARRKKEEREKEEREQLGAHVLWHMYFSTFICPRARARISLALRMGQRFVTPQTDQVSRPVQNVKCSGRRLLARAWRP